MRLVTLLPAIVTLCLTQLCPVVSANLRNLSEWWNYKAVVELLTGLPKEQRTLEGLARPEGPARVGERWPIIVENNFRLYNKFERVERNSALQYCLYSKIPKEEIYPPGTEFGDGQRKYVKPSVWNSIVRECKGVEGWHFLLIHMSDDGDERVELDRHFDPATSEHNPGPDQAQQFSVKGLKELGLQLGKTALPYFSRQGGNRYVGSPTAQRALFQGVRPRGI